MICSLPDRKCSISSYEIKGETLNKGGQGSIYFPNVQTCWRHPAYSTTNTYI